MKKYTAIFVLIGKQISVILKACNVIWYIVNVIFESIRQMLFVLLGWKNNLYYMKIAF